jgi:hypothetical protein
MTTLRINKVIRSGGRIPIKKGLWCPLRKMYFPKVFAFVGADPSEDDTPISCLYTLDPRAVSLIEGVRVVPIVGLTKPVSNITERNR